MTAPTGEELYNAWKARPGRTKQQVAEFYNLTYGQAAGRIWRHEQLLKGRAPEDRRLFSFDPEAPLVLDGDWMVIGDVHAPTTDYDLAQLVGAVAQRRGITQLLIAGDILNNDVFSTHPNEDQPIPWERERAAARQLLEEWLEVFSRIVWTAGNHERRLSKQTWGAYGMHELHGILISHDPRVQVSRYGYCTIQTPVGAWRITHPKKYSKMPIKTGSDIAMRKGCHTWVFHQHHLGVSWSECGRYLVVNGGGLFEPASMDYVSLDDTVMPVMAKGFGLLQGGYPELFGEEPFTNWRAVLSDNESAAELRLAA